MSISHNNSKFTILSTAMNLNTLLTCLLCLPCILFSQSNESSPNLFFANLDFDTQQSQIYEQNGIKIIANLQKCNDPAIGMEKDYIFLTIENTNSELVKVSLDQQLYFNNQCRTCLNDEYHFSFLLTSNETIVSSCTLQKIPGLKIFHGSPWVNEKLTKFELINIKVESQ